MKANFPIKNNDCNDKKLTKKNNDEMISYEKHLKSLPEGWNLWSLRSSEKIHDDLW